MFILYYRIKYYCIIACVHILSLMPVSYVANNNHRKTRLLHTLLGYIFAFSPHGTGHSRTWLYYSRPGYYMCKGNTILKFKFLLYLNVEWLWARTRSVWEPFNKWMPCWLADYSQYSRLVISISRPSETLTNQSDLCPYLSLRSWHRGLTNTTAKSVASCTINPDWSATDCTQSLCRHTLILRNVVVQHGLSVILYGKWQWPHPNSSIEMHHIQDSHVESVSGSH